MDDRKIIKRNKKKLVSVFKNIQLALCLWCNPPVVSFYYKPLNNTLVSMSGIVPLLLENILSKSFVAEIC